MASTDVIRGHARLRLSIKQLFSLKDGGVVTKHVSERCHDVIRADPSEGSPNDLNTSPSRCASNTKQWLGAPSRMWMTSVPVIAAEEPEVWSTSADMAFQKKWHETPMDLTSVPVMVKADPGVMSATAIMTSKDHIPVTMPPSGVCVGGGRPGEDINNSSFSLSHLSSMKYEHDCLEELSALSILDDTKEELSFKSKSQETQHLTPDVVKLLETIQNFGLQSRPVQYQEKCFRTGSSEIFCKNLFLKDRRGQLYLVICEENEDINLKTLRRKLKAYRNFSFVLPEEMAAILQVSPGGVTPFALMHGTARDVRVAITTDLTTNQEALLNFHPLDQSLTLPVKLNHLKQFLAHYRFELEYLDMDS